jgi:hypothetical protein
MVIEVTGKIEFEPENVTRKHLKQTSWKRVAMIRTDCDMHLYYAWFLKKRFNLELNKPLRGTHVTFISDRVEDRVHFDQAMELFNGKEIKFYVDPEPRSNGEHWWLRVYCPDAESIREIAGLERIPFFTFHLTLGHANERNIDHSNYILDQCKRFELISNEPRQPLEKHQIVKFS